MKPDVVYLLGSGSKHNDLELAHSLVSLQKHLKNHGKIWIVGGPPRHPKTPHIFELHGPDRANLGGSEAEHFKLREFLRHKPVSPDFILMHDDMFFLRDVEASEVKCRADGTLRDYINRRESSPDHRPGCYYTRCLQETERQLVKAGLPTRNYEIHYPATWNKFRFLRMEDSFDVTMRYLPLAHSLYGNLFEPETIETHDCKIDLPLTRHELSLALSICDFGFLSVADVAMGCPVVREFLQERFPL